MHRSRSRQSACCWAHRSQNTSPFTPFAHRLVDRGGHRVGFRAGNRDALAPRRVSASIASACLVASSSLGVRISSSHIHVVLWPQFLGRVGRAGLSGLEHIVTQALGDKADHDLLLGFRRAGVDWEIARQATVAAATVEVIRRVIFMGDVEVRWGCFVGGKELVCSEPIATRGSLSFCLLATAVHVDAEADPGRRPR